MIDIPSGPEAAALALQFKLQQSEKWPRHQRKAAQDKCLSNILSHAIQTVPYYNEHPDIKAMGANLNWNKIPILTREKLQQNTERLLRTAPPKSHGRAYEFRSSGSTGRPVKAFSSDYAQMFWRAFTARDHIWSNRNMSGKIATIKYHDPEKLRYPGAHQSGWGPSTNALGYAGQLIALNSCEAVEKQYQWLCENQPDYLLTYPSNLQELAALHKKNGKQLHLKGISTLGENLSSETRVLARETFRCRVSDMYSSQEVGYIALQCPKHDHYHIQQESCMVEILDDNNQPCPPGTMGRVVVTTLQNYIMPLIRYEIGDYAVPGEGCDCGITLPVIKHIAGRTRNLLTYPDGRKTWPSYNPMALMEIFPLSRFQLEQTAVNDITFRVMTEAEISSDDKQQAIKIIQDAMQHPFNITVEKADDLPRSAGGKYEEFKSVL